MSTKRKRLIEAVDSSPPVGTPTPKKRKGKRSNAEKAQIRLVNKKARSVYDVIVQQRGADLHDCTVHFIRTPSRRTEPEYYKLVQSPIDLTRIQQKINSEEYFSFEQFCSDFELLIENSKAYYKEESDEHKDANILLGLYKDACDKLEKGLPLSIEESSDECDDDAASPAPPSVAKSISSRGGSRASTASLDAIEPIQEFPRYYEIISHPIDLKRIAQKGRAGEYKHMQELEADIRLLCRNAQQFAGKGTDIYKDAAEIVDYFKDRRDLVLEKGVHPKRREKVIRVVDSLLVDSISSVGSEAYSEDSEEDEDLENSNDTKWQLYYTLRNEMNVEEKGSMLSDPFLELPSRSYYPDYYDDIKQPMSFFMINKKMKRGAYETLSELVTDFLQVFMNACEYNIEGSSIFTQAKKLEQLTLKKARQLQPSIDTSAFDKKVRIKLPPTPKMKALKVVPKLEPADTSSDEKDTPPPHKKQRSPRKQRPISTGMSSDLMAQPGKPGRKSMDELMLRYRQKLMGLWDVVYNYKDSDGYWPAGAFIELPSAKEYPDYYQVISNPIDMRMIRQRIETNGYDTSTGLLSDMKVMFNNCKKYNESGSQLYKDATRLEDMFVNAHNNLKDSPIESPVYLKSKFGWLKTKLPEKPKKSHRPSITTNGSSDILTPSSFSLSNGYYGLSDDDSSNSSIRSPAPSYTAKTPKAPKPSTQAQEKKLEEMISRLPQEQQRMWRLFNFIKDHRDEDGRKLATAFFRLPTREEYPSYYEVIKKPMDLQRVQQRLNSQGYGTWSDLVADLGLMLDNACKYNETDSDIYKDAVSLQRVLLEKKRELGATDDSMPRVQVEIRTMLTNIFGVVFSKKDSDGRCRSDSFAELPDLLKARLVPAEEWPFSFDQIKRNIDKCRYRRLDRFQKDFFDLFDKARQYSNMDSKLFDDATELQITFARERDLQCKSTLVSNAFMVLEKDIMEQSAKMRRRRVMNGEHSLPDRRESTDDIAMLEGEVEMDTITVKDVTYTVPSYCYVSRTDENSRGLPHIMRIERIFKNESGDVMVRGLWVYRPSETLHLPNRRFLENEVFITPFQDVTLAERLAGKCLVVSLKVYLNNTIENMEPKDVFVCESRYLGKPRYFVKLKSWQYPEEEDNLLITPRSRPISPIRVASEFVKGESETEDQSSASSSSEEDIRLRDAVVLDIDRPEVRVRGETAADADGRSYFCQMRTASGRHYACGDSVLVFNPHKPYCDVMRIDKLWRESDGGEWFSGGWFARPSDITHDPGRMFYQREVFAVSQPDQTRRVDDIQSHCAVLLVKEYVKCRPTEIAECDVFVCESRVNGSPLPKGETSSIFLKTPPGVVDDDDTLMPGEPMHIDNISLTRKMRTYKNGALVVDAELFLFKSPITMEKEMSPLLKSDIAVPLDPLDMDMLDENDTDGAESVASMKPELNTWLAAQPKLTAKSKSGYILFSAEIRKRIMHENPEAGFGEVSKIVGIEWKKLNDDQKRQYEVRAEYIATERAKQEAVRTEARDRLQPGQMRVYQCRWNTCDSQFDSENGLMEHIVQHHTSQIIMDSENQYVCMWVTCMRSRKDGKPFPSGPRLHRHMREKHLATTVRNMYQNQLGRNFYKCMTTQTGSGETYSLVHCPYGRGAGAPPPPNSVQHHLQHAQQHMPPTPQQGQTNGHHPGHHGAPSMMNGDHQPHLQQQQQQPHYAHPGQQMHAPPQSSSHQMTSSDPGRTLVKMPPGAEPVFVHAPSSFMSRRVLHSDTYLRYIESLGSNRQRTVSTWERSLSASAANTQPHQKKPLPGHWIRQVQGREVVPEEDVVRALWRMRDQIMESSVGVSSEREFAGRL